MRKPVSAVVMFYGLFHAAAALAAVIDVPRLAGKPQADVDAQLKSTPQCTKLRYGTSCAYRDGQVEITFIDGKADWITVKDLEKIPFDDAALAELGFNAMQPSFRSSTVMRWRKVAGTREISIFKGQSGVNYAHIKVATP